jgi:plasmid maintenance system antidote protein VapI
MNHIFEKLITTFVILTLIFGLTALLLSHYFGVSDSLWSNLQAHYNVECAKDALGEKLKTIPTCQAACQASH